MVPGRVNKDHFLNLKAQCWYHLRLMFQASWRASNGQEYDRDMVISIDPNLPELDQLLLEISQPTWSRNGVGKVVINKKPDGTASPNHADAVMIAFSPVNRWAEVWEKLA
jgi:hypothetical protein